MIRIVALDPGGTTGWATYTNYPEGVKKFACGQIGPEPHHEALDTFLGGQQTDIFYVVCESFEYRNQSRPGLVLDSVEYIGVVKRFCQERNVQLFMQTAGMGKGFVKDGNLRKLGLWEGTKWKHAMDAYRHLLYLIINEHVTLGLYDLRKRLLEVGWK